MKVKNISGSTLTFKAGKRTYTIANNASTVVDDTTEAMDDVAEHIEKHRLEIQVLPPASQFSGTPPTYGYADLAIGAIVDTDTVTIAGVTFEIDEADNGVTGTNIAVTAADATDVSVTAAGLKAAINANATLDALGIKADDIVDIGATECHLIVEARGTTAIADVAISQTGDNVTITKVNASEGTGYRTSVVTATASASTILINTGLDTIIDVFVSVRNSSGIKKAIDGTQAVGGGFVFIDDQGTTDIASGDVVTVVAIGK